MDARLSIPGWEYDQRIANVQKEMAREEIDVLIAHACECESANVRYLTNFWAVFDFAGVLVPREGKPILLTGGPESYDFAKEFARIDDSGCIRFMWKPALPSLTNRRTRMILQ